MTAAPAGRAPATPPDAPRPGFDRDRWLEVGILLVILAVAALTRLPGLDVRGQWDSDQGHDMRVLAAFVQGGQWPPLGPMTSVGTFHHGAFYYYLMAPSALVSAADPVAVTVEFALLGMAGVAATWWLARLVGGPVAAALAGLLLAVSPAGISESTFIWNPNPIPLFAALACVGVVQARRTGGVRWWALAGFGTMATMQLHWLGGVLLIPVGLAWILEARRRGRRGADRRALVRGGLVAVAIIALGYVPLLIHELTTGPTELQAIATYVMGGSEGSQTSLLGRLLMVPIRALTWPVAGLVTDRIGASLAALAIVVVLAVAGVVLSGRRGAQGGAGTGVEADVDAGDLDADTRRWAARWLVSVIALTTVALAFLAPSLAVIVPGLPNDHYHAFLDPVVVTLAGVGVAGLVRLALTSSSGRLLGPATAGALTAVLVAIAVTAWPPAVSPDGGWRLADLASAHVIQVVDTGWPSTEPRLLAGVPTFKPDDALRFPLERRGFNLEPETAKDMTTLGVLTIVCDPLFDVSSGFACGGPAEDRFLADTYPPGTMQLVERFRAGDRRIISIYGPSRLAAAP